MGNGAPSRLARERLGRGYTGTGRDMSHVASRLLTTATAAYGVYALVKPDHLGKAMEADTKEMAGYNGLARAYGVRDLTISAIGLLGRSRGAARTTMGLRIAADIADCATLVQRAGDPTVKRKVAAVTLGYAALNATALLIDERRSD
jgi:hypothetical protein